MDKPFRRADLPLLVIALIVPQAAGALGSLFTVAAIPTWYATLVRPELAPPNGLFAPVWTTLFLLMGIAAFLVARTGMHQGKVRGALVLFGIQLVLNVLWSFLFFGMHAPGLALIEIAVLWLAIAATLLAFLKISRTAGLLLTPYLLWVTFAAYLNYSFWSLNG